MKHLLIIIGTRPELIKLAPVILELNRRGLQDHYTVLNTAQHKDLLNPFWKQFKIKPHFTLNVMKNGQSLTELTSKVLSQIEHFIKTKGKNVDTILAQGDTTTVFGASIVAFYNRLNFIHLEAGLRSNDLNNPYPEEFNRRVATIVTKMHLAPTIESATNLLKEGINKDKIRITGNTVVDALNYIITLPNFYNLFNLELLNKIKLEFKKCVLITCHRRENHGNNLKNIICAICELAMENPDLKFIWPLHPNPNIHDVVNKSNLVKFQNILITPPLDYIDILRVLCRCCVVISDSGGIQEEAPSLNIPVIILRETTERPEGVNAGIAVLTGANISKIKEGFKWGLDVKLDKTKNPYGDGYAAAKVVNAIMDLS